VSSGFLPSLTSRANLRTLSLWDKLMKRDYQKPEWKDYRDTIIAHDGGRCQHCSRTTKEGVILQVHHKVYHSGLLLWEYPPIDCMTLCRGCHLKEHGKIRPSSGWILSSHEDLGELAGECEVCGTALRYEFHVEHPHWFSMIVGTDCCDRLMESNVATCIRRQNERLTRFIKSDRWRNTSKGIEIRQMKMDFLIDSDAKGYFIVFEKVCGKKRFSTIEDAKVTLFNLIETGGASDFYKKHKSN